MKKNIFLILFAFIGFAFTADAQSCCSSKAKSTSSCAKKTATASKSCCATKTAETTKACCAKKASATADAVTDSNGKALLVSNETAAHNETKKFTVYGNCGMCKKTIEGSLKGVKGVISGVWDIETDEMTVTFNPHKITLDDIKQKIADVGYDTDTHRAKEEVYNSLPGCCQYDRPEN